MGMGISGLGFRFWIQDLGLRGLGIAQKSP